MATTSPTRRGSAAPAATATSRSVGDELVRLGRTDGPAVLRETASTFHGLTEAEADGRLARHGDNTVHHERPPRWTRHLLSTLRSPFVAILVTLAGVLAAVGDATGAATIGVMIALSVALRFVQERRSARAAERLRTVVQATATTLRRAEDLSEPVEREVPFEQLVPGDVIRLAGGDLVPADCRLLAARALTVAQSALTGESRPVEKHPGPDAEDACGAANPLDIPTMCFLGTEVVTGSGTAVVTATGDRTYFGAMAGALAGSRAESEFDRGVRRVGWTLVRFMLVMVPVVLAVAGVTRGDWFSALLFAVAVAVGLTPEMLPVIVTANLARGAVAMATHRVIVKRLDAIHNLGAMDVLCTDKTGTLTDDRVVVERFVDLAGEEDASVLELAYLNASRQAGPPTVLDRALLAHADPATRLIADARYCTVDEVPFDFERRRMSVVVAEAAADGHVRAGGAHLMIVKGAVPEVLDACDRVRVGGRSVPLSAARRGDIVERAAGLAGDGLRVLAVATRALPAAHRRYDTADERGLTIVGMVCFLDPPRGDAEAALFALARDGVAVKVVTGDDELVARRLCTDLGLPDRGALLGERIEAMDDPELRDAVAGVDLFAKVTPLQKARVVAALQARGHVVGYLGDGINDAAALRDADVGISVDTATDIAKESADVILLAKDLAVVQRGVTEGRRTFGNIMKYVKATASSNFGNVLSVLAAGVFLPFLPMLPIHLLVQNLLYDISQLAVPWDRMDREHMVAPRRWAAGDLTRFMLVFGPVSSLFDLATFGVLWFVLAADTVAEQALFQSGWFVMGLLSQVLAVHVIRTRGLPLRRGRRATGPVVLLGMAIIALGVAVPYSPLAGPLQMQALPAHYLLWLVPLLIGYCTAVQYVKIRYIARNGTWL